MPAPVVGVKIHGGIGNALQSLPLIRHLQSLGITPNVLPGRLESGGISDIFRCLAQHERVLFDANVIMQFVLDLPYFKNCVSPMTGMPLFWHEVFDVSWGWLSGEAALYLRMATTEKTLPPPQKYRFYLDADIKRVEQWKGRTVVSFEGKRKQKIKRYPFAVEVAERLPGSVFVGLERLPALPESVIDLRGKLKLTEVAALLGSAKRCIANDSGIAHLSAAVGCPTFVIFGPTSPLKNRPPWPWVEVFTKQEGCIDCQSKGAMKEDCPLSMPPPCLSIDPGYILAEFKKRFP